eukprot:3272348-Pleurochrysis_carterae.AAC.5
MGTLSDPGPRYREATGAAARHDDYDSGDDASLATENSDEEPLDGSPEEHVEAMLSKCLEPDERQVGTVMHAVRLGSECSKCVGRSDVQEFCSDSPLQAVFCIRLRGCCGRAT